MNYKLILIRSLFYFVHKNSWTCCSYVQTQLLFDAVHRSLYPLNVTDKIFHIWGPGPCYSKPNTCFSLIIFLFNNT